MNVIVLRIKEWAHDAVVQGTAQNVSLRTDTFNLRDCMWVSGEAHTEDPAATSPTFIM